MKNPFKIYNGGFKGAGERIQRRLNILVAIVALFMVSVTAVSAAQNWDKVDPISIVALSAIPGAVWINEDDTFKQLTAKEVSELDEDSVEKYYNALDEHRLKIQKELDTKVAAKAEKSEIKDLQGQVDKLLISELTTKINSLNLKFKALEEDGNAQKLPTTLKGLIVKSLIERKDDLIASITEQKTVKLDIDLKVVAEMGTGNATGATVNPALSFERFMGLVPPAEKIPFILDIISTGNTNSSTLYWIEKKNQEGNADFLAEGGLKPLTDFEEVVATSTAKEIAAKTKVSKWALKDIENLATDIESHIRKEINLEIERVVLFGDETANPEEFDGINDYAAAYIGATVLSETIADANNFDAIRAVIAQIINSSDGAFYPTHAFVNPFDHAAMDLTKNADSSYTIPPFVVMTPSGDVTVAGVRVVPKTRIVAGAFTIGDMSRAFYRTYEPLSIEIGTTNDDFEKNKRTIIGETRAHFFIRSNEATAFVNDTFAVVKADLDPAVV